MFYYHVWVRSTQYRGSSPLTYHFADKLADGALVEVPLRNQTVLGVVVGAVRRPKFSTKSIEAAFDLPLLPDTTIQLAVWLQQFYSSPIGVIAQQFLPPSISRRRMEQQPADKPAKVKPAIQPPLTAEQVSALKQIKKPDTFILHGRTGSGKTRLYTELTRQALDNGKSVVILSPEIGLTSQLAANFRRLFGELVVVLHSQLTPKEHETAWLTILRSSTPLIVIGPRSALFSPLKAVGLIVIDESHDSAYKQEQPPYYHAVRVASQLRHIHNATLILGSATPSIPDYYLALEKQKTIIRLSQLAIPSTVRHKATVVDLKDHSQFLGATHLSRPLIDAITSSLERQEQTLLYLNRRGTARITLCQVCGWQALCPRCDLPLTYHGDSHTLRCHVCGYTQAPILSCPNCGNPSVSFHSFGTKAIVDEARQVFPEARILRFDTDNLKSERLEHQYQQIIDGKVDILIGTQMLAKGLDLPKLSTLGIIAADSSLYLPDFTAQERTYQLLTQVLGRIGRGHIDSQAIIQTYHPDSPVLKAALHDDWESFYNNEVTERRKYSFPPFCHLLKLICRRSSPSSAEKAAQSFKNQLDLQKLPITIDGPAPAFYEKAGGKYRWQLVIKASQRSQLLAVIARLPAVGWSYDLDPVDLL